ncbi:MAG: ComEC/Rec2 family competence protein [Myxococcota bacterium]
MVLITLKRVGIDRKGIILGGILWAAFLCALNNKDGRKINIEEGNIVFDGYVIDTPYYNRDSTIYQINVQRYIQADELHITSFNMQYIASIPFAEPIRNDFVRARCRIYIDKGQIPDCISDLNNPPLVIEREGFGIYNAIDGYKEGISRFIYSHYKGSAALIMSALSTGNSKGLTYELRRIFAINGTSHILAISGTHIGLIALFLYYIVKLLIFPFSLIRPFSLKKASSLILIPILIIVSFYFGNSPSVVRATIMVIVYLFSVLIERERDILSSLCISFLLITSHNPDSIRDIGFQLSFLSVSGIITLIPSITNRWEIRGESIRGEIIRYILILLLTSLAASLFTLPVVAYHFGIISIIGIIANLIIVPFVGVIILPIILCGVISFGISLSLAGFFFNGAFSSIEHFIKLNELFANLPLSHIKIFAPSIFEIAIYFAIIFTFILRERIPFTKIVIPSLLLILIITSLIMDRIERNKTEPSIIVQDGVITFIDEDLRPHLILGKASNRDKRTAVEFLRKKRLVKVLYTNLNEADDLYIKDHLYTKEENGKIETSEKGDVFINMSGFITYIFNDTENCPPTAARFVISRRSSEEAIKRLYECGISPNKLIFSGDIKNRRILETLIRFYGEDASKTLICKEDGCKIVISPAHQ